MMDPIVEEVGLSDLKTLKEVRDIYEVSFPENEKTDWHSILEELAEEPAYKLLAFKDMDGTILGFCTTRDLPSFLYIEYLATSPSCRNGGIGRKAFSQVISRTTKPIVLEVEVPESDISIRRVQWYQRQGFIMSTKHYVAPPMPEYPFPMELKLMFRGTNPTQIEETHLRAQTEVHFNVYRVDPSL